LFFAINGNDALDKIRQNPDVDIVLSDINMPEMDGLTLLTRLGESSPLIKAVIVSCLWRYGKYPYGHEPGASYDFITKAYQF
jgi:YesN/AraC family two-component response regulator